MLRTITKLSGICIDINIEILILILNRLALEITFLLNQCFSHKWLTSYSHKVENLICAGVVGEFLKRINGGALIRDPIVYDGNIGR